MVDLMSLDPSSYHGHHGHRIDLNTLRRRYPVSLRGVTLRVIIQVANQMQLTGKPLRFELTPA
jgi:ATP-binding cassette, subfamily B, bacterial CvaB/MchF/RaxB